MAAPLLVAVMGVTASGKTALAEALALHLDAQLISADAFQVYRGMDIGTAKPPNKADYRLLDLREPDEAFGVGEWVRLAQAELEELYARGRNAIVVGGTGYYVRALLEEYADLRPPPDPELRRELDERLAAHGLPTLARELERIAPEVAARTDLKNPARVRRALERELSPHDVVAIRLPPFRRIKLGIECPTKWVEEQIAARVEQMVHNGWAGEVARLLDQGYRPEHPGFRAIGYRAMARFVEGEMESGEAAASVIVDTRNYAKRQRTWLRREPGLEVLAHGSLESLTEQALAAIHQPMIGESSNG
ncbi:MAG: tRNA (adenosine(37)-N6)-dimethylallyltransferase MiaA, partial [Fimbriimonas ginsengisoli]|uniref:tRNA dimethylallyltransferase n=1 Tax=Fimbriimonas ginsengisoli TaxID=1005039 RepID=A0A931PVP9_FIMGI|nr:tRNA (adenosine(37)-N6)-dimethylallyltransferase MiaA [Fimbriimonas ginsengisoli]MBI3721537.1 tRNA (adenosine(37)-N6)-dimethylallyltransferase MiaA [Fimbriimonas ginsengisoli]